MKSADSAIDAELVALETGTIDPAKFPHSEHVRLGYEMLGRHSFGEAVVRFSRGLRHLASKSGRPGVYHETITIGFLAVIGERRARGKDADWTHFFQSNGDLLDKHCLERWYDPAQLSSELARGTFCLPAPREETPAAASVNHGLWPAPARAIATYLVVFCGYIAWSSLKTAAHAYGPQRRCLRARSR